MTAEEFLAELEQDKDFQARRRERDEQLGRAVAAHRAEEAPLLRELQDMGIEVNSVWDLVNTSEDYSRAYPVLVQHLHRPYQPKLREGIARALTVANAHDVAWRPVLKAFVEEQDRTTIGAKWALANALAELMNQDVLGEVIGLVLDDAHGENRAILVEKLAAFADNEDVRRALERLSGDPDVAREARRALKHRR